MAHRNRKLDSSLEGCYLIEGLPEGEYLVAAIGRRQGYLSELYDNARRREDATPVPVTAGNETSGINFALARPVQLANAVPGRAPELILGLVNPARDAAMASTRLESTTFVVLYPKPRSTLSRANWIASRART
ncbi:MAG TPA: hypothetical protein EYP04_04335 [Anaerolineae bacterium]|nr:hypothetical protein [Anaerolineae bacterium]HIQ05358.1 hypothetical protein [Anaerolineae bacterium]